MTKVVYNNCFGGFSISEKALLRYAELKGVTVYPEKSAKYHFKNYWSVPPSDPERLRATRIQDNWAEATDEGRQWSNDFCTKHQLSLRDYSRKDPVLVQVVEELGEEANGDHASLAIEDVPAGSKYRIDEYDGNERVMQPDDYDWEEA